MASKKLSSQLIQQITRNNLIETLGENLHDFRDDFKKQVKTNLHDSGIDLHTQLIGPEKISPQKSGDLTMGEELNLRDLRGETPNNERAQVEIKNIAPALDYHAEIKRGSERSSKKEFRDIEQQIREIMDELQRLVASSDKVVQMTYGDLAVGQKPATPGTYHINFFTYMLSVIRSARQKVEDSGAWLNIAKRKGNLIQNAWKKGNTSITMSNERQVATQTG